MAEEIEENYLDKKSKRFGCKGFIALFILLVSFLAYMLWDSVEDPDRLVSRFPRYEKDLNILMSDINKNGIEKIANNEALRRLQSAGMDRIREGHRGARFPFHTFELMGGGYSIGYVYHPGIPGKDSGVDVLKSFPTSPKKGHSDVWQRVDENWFVYIRNF